jgi:hypothetical protein
MSASRLPIVSLVFGAVSLGCFLWLAYIFRFRMPSSGYVLQFIADLGLVHSGPSYIAELKPASVFSLNDGNAILWLNCFAFASAIVAAVSALASEWKRESSPYAAAGFIAGTSGMWLVSPVAGLASQALGAALLLFIRRSHAARA